MTLNITFGEKAHLRGNSGKYSRKKTVFFLLLLFMEVGAVGAHEHFLS